MKNANEKFKYEVNVMPRYDDNRRFDCDEHQYSGITLYVYAKDIQEAMDITKSLLSMKDSEYEITGVQKRTMSF